MTPKSTAVADHALLVEFATEISEQANQSVVALDRALAASPPTGMLEVVPAFVSLLIEFDPLVTDHDELDRAVEALLSAQDGHQPAPKRHRVPVCYAAAFAPDLEGVADAAGISQEAVVDAHLAGDYRVFMYGFAPGYAYMAGVPPAIQLPRKPAAVRGVGAGSLIVAGPQCLITTLAMPTGWWVLGRSPSPILRPHATRPFLFDVGDHVAFERIDLGTYERLARHSARVEEEHQP